MKTLDQLDARLGQIDARQTAAAGKLEARTPISDLPINITVPGSYYLTENVVGRASEENGITVSVSHVTIDLNGFSLAGSGASGIFVAIAAGNGVGAIVTQANVAGNTNPHANFDFD